MPVSHGNSLASVPTIGKEAEGDLGVTVRKDEAEKRAESIPISKKGALGAKRLLVRPK